MLFSSRNFFAMLALLIASFTGLAMAHDGVAHEHNDTAVTYTPSVSVTSHMSSPTGTSNGTSSNSSVSTTNSPSNTPATGSASMSMKEAGFGTAGLAVFVVFAVASL